MVKERKIVALLNDESGQSMVEYGLIISLLVVVVILTLTNLGKSVESMYNNDIKPFVMEALSG